MDRTADPDLTALYEEVQQYPGVVLDPSRFEADAAAHDLVLPMTLDHPAGRLSFFSTIATFGTAIDITLEDLAIEAFFPADEATGEVLRTRAD